ncbi:MAG: peptidoglycan editing factor PgeF [Bacillota bacterium]
MQGIRIAQKGDFQYIQFDSFTKDHKITHGFTTRKGGVSKRPYHNLNMALHVGDEPVHVRANRAVACAALGINPADLVAAMQVHGSRVEAVDSQHRGKGALEYAAAIPDTDALITKVPGVPLSSYYADCVPILLYDPVKICIGLAHAGWRGTFLRIAGETVAQMQETYGSNPGDILAGIGPSIGPCCYQVDVPVRQALAKDFPDWQELLTPTGPDRWLLDLWETNRRVLLAAGIKSENITLAGLCTACRTDLFFSYRVEQGKTGRMASLLMIKE